MSNNPFKPPTAALRVSSSGTPQPVRGVLLGLAVYVAGSFVLVNVLVLAVVHLGTNNAPVKAGVALVLTSALDPLSGIGALVTSVVMAMSFAAGYACAAVARAGSLIAPTIVATVAVSLELFFGPGAQPTGVWLGLTALTFVLTLAGGFAWIRQESRQVMIQ